MTEKPENEADEITSAGCYGIVLAYQICQNFLGHHGIEVDAWFPDQKHICFETERHKVVLSIPDAALVDEAFRLAEHYGHQLEGRGSNVDTPAQLPNGRATDTV